MPKLEVGDVYRLPADEKPNRLWLVEHVTPCGATVRPYTKKAVDYQTVEGVDVHFEALDGKRTQISATSDVKIVERGVEFRDPRWLWRVKNVNRKAAGV